MYIPTPSVDDPVEIETPLNYNLVFFQGEGQECHIHPTIGANLPIHNLLLRDYTQDSATAREIIHEISLEELEKQPGLLASAIIKNDWRMDHSRLGRIIRTYNNDDLIHKWNIGKFVWDEGNTLEEIENILVESLFNPIKYPTWKCANWRNIVHKNEDIVIAHVNNTQISAYGWRITHIDHTVYNEYKDLHLLATDCKWVEELQEYDLKGSLEWSESLNQWINPMRTEEYKFATDIEEWLHADECFYCEFTDEYRSVPTENRVLAYHSSTHKEIKEPAGAKWTIGFEIEKEFVYNEDTGQTVRSEGDEIEDQPFFWKWETDSSCGIEGVSNAYDLFQSKDIRQDIRMSDYIDAPVETTRAGGHVSVRCNEYTRSFGLAEIRPYAGLIYALWRFRLRSEYCSKNKKLDEAAYQDRYDVIRVRGRNFLEFRLPSRVKSKKQLIWRYKLFHCTIRAMKESRSFDDYLRNTSSLLDEVYGLEKKDKILALAKSFENYLNNGVISSDISEFI